MLVTAAQLNHYNGFVSNLFATNLNTSVDVNRTSYDGSTGNSYYNEKKYWVNKLIYGISEDIVTAEFNIAYSPKIITTQLSVDPLAETFFIDSTTFPNGRFISSIEVYFATKDATIPVNIEIRPVVNGYPSSSCIIPLSQKSIKPVNVSTPTNIETGLGTSTVFTFDDIVYLKPGQYTFILTSNSDNYNVYISKFGSKILGTNKTVTNKNYIGVLFKSQNASTWSADQTLDICFKINACKFSTGSYNMDFYSKTRTSALSYDYVQLLSQDLLLNESTTSSYSIITKNSGSSVYNSPVTIYNNKLYQFGVRQQILARKDSILRVNLSNTDPYISPILDIERLDTILIQNSIIPKTTAIQASELLAKGGGAGARYISKRITLNDDFRATGITVYLAVNRQIGTSIEVFYKVSNQFDYNFDDNPYVKMTYAGQGSSTPPTTKIDEYVEDKYQNLNITYSENGTSYVDFNTVAIKVVMYSDNPALVPQIQQLRIICTA